MAMTTKEKMHSKQLYVCIDDELFEEQTQCMEVLYEYNHSRPSEHVRRKELLREFLAEVGDNCHIEPPLHANWGCHTHLGKNVYANFNLTLVDDTDIYIGDYVMLGPNVTIATAGHPIAPELRKTDLPQQFNIPVVIESNVWVGAGAVILPGVTIGENSVIGAGSIVTKNIPAHVIAVGNPCCVLREIGEHDRIYYYKDMKIM